MKPRAVSAMRACSSCMRARSRCSCASASCLGGVAGGVAEPLQHRLQVALAGRELPRQPHQLAGAGLVEELLEVEDVLLQLGDQQAVGPGHLAGHGGRAAGRRPRRAARGLAHRGGPLLGGAQRGGHVGERLRHLARRHLVAPELGRRWRRATAWRARVFSVERGAERQPLRGGDRAAVREVEPVAEVGRPAAPRRRGPSPWRRGGARPRCRS